MGAYSSRCNLPLPAAPFHTEHKKATENQPLCTLFIFIKKGDICLANTHLSFFVAFSICQYFSFLISALPASITNPRVRLEIDRATSTMGLMVLVRVFFHIRPCGISTPRTAGPYAYSKSSKCNQRYDSYSYNDHFAYFTFHYISPFCPPSLTEYLFPQCFSIVFF